MRKNVINKGINTNLMPVLMQSFSLIVTHLIAWK